QGVSSAKQAIKGAAATVNKAIKSSIQIMKNLRNNPAARKRLLDKAKDYALGELKKLAMEKAAEKYVEGICTQIHENQINKAAEKDDNWKVNWDKMDVLGVTDISKECDNPQGSNGQVNCAN
ncbi:MAG: hypothetical protein ACKO96_24620, partial [Flammeovirgaceae bacterium]